MPVDCSVAYTVNYSVQSVLLQRFIYYRVHGVYYSVLFTEVFTVFTTVLTAVF